MSALPSSPVASPRTSSFPTPDFCSPPSSPSRVQAAWNDSRPNSADLPSFQSPRRLTFSHSCPDVAGKAQQAVQETQSILNQIENLQIVNQVANLKISEPPLKRRRKDPVGN